MSGQDLQNDPTATKAPDASASSPKPSLTSDLKRLWAAAVKIGATLAIVCHLLPPHYQAACHTIATICGSH